MVNFYPYKKFYKSRTFWASLVGGIFSVTKILAGIKSSDDKMIISGATELAGFYAAWGLRRGLSSEIQ